MSQIQVFEREAARYDAWFDAEPGKTLFASELLCLQQLTDDLPRPWLEIGVGTGRFARALRVDVGVDPAAAVLSYAKHRGVHAIRAGGHSLPFRDQKFGAILIVVTLCFADEPKKLMREAARVVCPGGGIVLGIVPADSPWGKHYLAQASAGHLFYSHATFFTRQEVRSLAAAADLQFVRSCSTLLQTPGKGPFTMEHPCPGEHHKAGFVGMLFRPDNV